MGSIYLLAPRDGGWARRGVGRRGVRPCPRRPRARGRNQLLRLLLVEDHAAFRTALAFLVGRQPGMEVLAQCASLSEARAFGGLAAVDVALLDLVLPDGRGTELVAVLRGANPDVKVLILSASIDPGVRERATEAGADGLLDKMAPMREIAAEIRRLTGVGGA
jgi:DNA-binding NarL/FixJ family response regulator